MLLQSVQVLVEFSHWSSGTSLRLQMNKTGGSQMAGITRRTVGWPADNAQKGKKSKRGTKLLKIKKTTRPKGKK